MELDALDRKLNDTLPGRVVRKDLVQEMKTGFNVSIYVLEYLLGQYCSSTDPEVVERGLESVRQTLSRNYVRADESEKIKAITRQKGKHRVIDKVKAHLDTQTNRFWAALTNMGVADAVIEDQVVHQYDKLLMGGIWALVDLQYDPEFKAGGATRPFIIDGLKPIQQPSTELDEYLAARESFTRDEWLDILLRTTGLEATHPDFTLRKKMFHLMRLVKTSHLLQPLSDQMLDMALIDRLHFYLPGWEVEKMRPEYLTDHYGMVVDYATEVWRGLRKTSYGDAIERYFNLGSHEAQAIKGNGELRVTGAPSRSARDAMKTAHTYLRTNASRLGLSKSPGDYDLHAQLVDLMGAKQGSEVGIAFFVAMVGALLGKPVEESLVILGEMSLTREHQVCLPQYPVGR